MPDTYSIALTGADTISINGRVLVDLADGNVGHLTFPNEIAKVKVGKNNNAIFALDETGNVGEKVLRIIRGSGDDKFLNNLFIQQKQNFATFPPMFGELVKQVGNADGLVADTYQETGGVFTKPIEVKSNVEGDTDQSVAIYTIRFAKVQRSIT